MSVSTFDSLTRQTATSLIAFYQQQLSPRKGFSCAYRILHSRESCSQYVKRAIQDHGLMAALPLIQERFEDCKVANQILRNRRARRQRQQAVWQSLQTKPEIPAMPHSIPRSPRAILHIENEFPEDETSPEEEETEAVNRPLINAGATGSMSDSSGASSVCDGDVCAVLDCVNLVDCTDSCEGLNHSGAHCAPTEIPDCSTLDCSTLDCSSVDCSSMDCSGCDVGSCS